MDRIMKIVIQRESGEIETFTRPEDKWLFICAGKGGNICSLSGDDVQNAFLLRVLENFVVDEMNKIHRLGRGDATK